MRIFWLLLRFFDRLFLFHHDLVHHFLFPFGFHDLFPLNEPSLMFGFPFLYEVIVPPVPAPQQVHQYQDEEDHPEVAGEERGDIGLDLVNDSGHGRFVAAGLCFEYMELGDYIGIDKGWFTSILGDKIHRL
jgi:hypothetical protein